MKFLQESTVEDAWNYYHIMHPSIMLSSWHQFLNGLKLIVEVTGQRPCWTDFIKQTTAGPLRILWQFVKQSQVALLFEQIYELSQHRQLVALVMVVLTYSHHNN